ncbi:uncharacterized protein LOC108678319 [Hyalella azteca]|uniref:Uncharacterized protein LOC108678319 n=1 Tax=Hyalella azteca TaxID=294128 RepID=A0A8B7PAG8_HYAAZ|nr:uncharacterized protein LOC108678319 [Hyalella azteca]
MAMRPAFPALLLLSTLALGTSSGQPLESVDLMSLISLVAPRYSRASPAHFHTQPLNLSYTTLTVPVVHTVTAVHYHTCTAVRPGTPPCAQSHGPLVVTATSMEIGSAIVTPLMSSVPAQAVTGVQETSNFIQKPLKLIQSLNENSDVVEDHHAEAVNDVQLQQLEENNEDAQDKSISGNTEAVNQASRTARLFSGLSMIVLTRSVFETQTSTVTVTDSLTTVAITYGGCVPSDAFSTVTCQP